MKLGEKLQQLRKQSGLSQEQLAARLTVSRQAVSKWELDETMPDTENVVQLSRLFGVSCDYLLRDEVDERGAPLPAPQTGEQAAADGPGGASAGPGETHLSESGWVRNAFALSLFTCIVGLLVALGGWLQWRVAAPLILGLIIELSGMALFELAVPRMGSRRKTARLTFYMIANWFLMPIPAITLCWWSCFYVRTIPRLYWEVACLSCYFLLCAVITAVLAILRRRQAHKS